MPPDSEARERVRNRPRSLVGEAVLRAAARMQECWRRIRGYGCGLLVGALVWLGGGCGDDGEPAWRTVPSTTPLTVFATEEIGPRLQLSFAGVPLAFSVRTVADPRAALAPAEGLRAAVISDLDCRECYRLEGEAGAAVVRCGRGDVLGCSYGVTAWLEQFGVRFFHPFDTFVPSTFAVGDVDPALRRTALPEIPLRGLQLHTLHPIESLADFWIGGDGSVARAERTLDWIVHQRGNYVQWGGVG